MGRRWSWLVWAAVAAGLLLRGYHYARGPAPWHDEAAMVVNVVRLPLEGTLGPLLYDEAAPPLFLLLEKATVAVLGDGLYALRLPSFLAGCASVVVVALLSRRLFSPVWAAVAVGLVSTSDCLLFHAAEAKSYSFDVLIAATASYFVVATWRWPLWARGLVGAAVAPACLWVSFPACFVCGGVLVALLPRVWRSDWKGRVGYAAFAAAVGVAFLLLVLGPAKAQRTEAMEDCWGGGSFADWSNPLRVPVWVFFNSFDVVRYCFHPFGYPILVLAITGAWSFLRKPTGRAVACAAGLPMLLVLLAALLGKYPYSAARTVAFLTPGLAVLAVEGLRRVWAWLWPKGWRWRWVLFAWAAILLNPTLYTLRRVVDPWERAECDHAAEVVLNERTDGEPIHANHWEYDYLFRRVPADRVRIEHRFSPPPGRDEWLALRAAERSPRIWVVHQENPQPEGFTYKVPAGYQISRVRAYKWVRVWELTPTE